MNKWNRLLASLDEVFGFNIKIRSKYRKRSPGFDEKTNEHVILIEYRVSVKGTMKSAPRKKQEPNQMAMIQQLLAQNQNKKKRYGALYGCPMSVWKLTRLFIRMPGMTKVLLGSRKNNWIKPSRQLTTRNPW